jgi:hypothetical protein
MHAQTTAAGGTGQIPLGYGDPRVPQRLWDKVGIDPATGCWPWLGARWGHKKSYGAAWYENFTWRAHRLFFTLLVRPVADDEHVHHDCRNGLCCNPAHISALHESEHWGHGHSDKTHCPYGHEYTPENTHVQWRKLKSGRMGPNRYCLTCRREQAQRYQAKHRNKES